MPSPDPLYGTTKAAEYTTFHPVTLRRLRAEGKGPEFIKVSSRKVLYRKSALDRWLRSKTVKPCNE